VDTYELLRSGMKYTSVLTKTVLAEVTVAVRVVEAMVVVLIGPLHRKQTDGYRSRAVRSCLPSKTLRPARSEIAIFALSWVLYGIKEYVRCSRLTDETHCTFQTAQPIHSLITCMQLKVPATF
jgi:hypothetical protein